VIKFTRLRVPVDRQDVLVVVALVLWGVGFWRESVAVALGCPALVLLWYALPSRPPFIRSEGKDR
jgi:hypothetical protein